jgi:YD repeat-containing protein
LARITDAGDFGPVRRRRRARPSAGQLRTRQARREGRPGPLHFDFNGNATTYHYDEFDNLTGITFPDGSQTVTEYEHSHSRVIREIDQDGILTLKTATATAQSAMIGSISKCSERLTKCESMQPADSGPTITDDQIWP